MKRAVIFIFFLWSLTGQSQIEIYNVSLTDSTKSILYRGANNRLNIYGIDDYYIVKVAPNIRQFGFRKDSSTVNSFIIIPYLEKYDTISIYKNDSLLYYKHFDCFNLPYVKAIFGQVEDTLLSKNEIISNPILSLVLPNCYYNPRCLFKFVEFDVNFMLFTSEIKRSSRKRVGNYKVNYHRIDNSTIIANVTQLRDSIWFYNEEYSTLTGKIRRNKTNKVFGNCLSNLHISIINNMKTGDKIYFENIKIRPIDGCDLLLAPISITIK